MALVRAFMTHGHLKSDLDPLHLDQAAAEMDLSSKYALPTAELQKLVDYKFYGFSEGDLDKKFHIDVPDLGGLLSKKKDWTLREINESFTKAYCDKVGVEFMHIPDRSQCTWLRNKFELRQYEPMTNERKTLVLDRLMWADEFS